MCKQSKNRTRTEQEQNKNRTRTEQERNDNGTRTTVTEVMGDRKPIELFCTVKRLSITNIGRAFRFNVIGECLPHCICRRHMAGRCGLHCSMPPPAPNQFQPFGLIDICACLQSSWERTACAGRHHLLHTAADISRHLPAFSGSSIQSTSSSSPVRATHCTASPARAGAAQCSAPCSTRQCGPEPRSNANQTLPRLCRP